MRSRLAMALALGATLVVGVVATATAGQTQACDLSTLGSACSGLTLEAGLFPTALPKKSLAPVTLQMSGKLGGFLPASGASELTFDFYKNGSVNATHLPSCKRSQLLTSVTEFPQGPCSKAVLGTGTVTFEVESSGNSPISVPITLYNGGVRDGTARLLISGFNAMLGSTATVATVNVTRIHEDPYGLQASVKVPPIADGKGSAHSFYFVINKRLFTFKGKKQSYAMARCLSGHLSARVSTTTVGGEEFSVPPSSPVIRRNERWAVGRPKPGKEALGGLPKFMAVAAALIIAFVPVGPSVGTAAAGAWAKATEIHPPASAKRPSQNPPLGGRLLQFAVLRRRRLLLPPRSALPVPATELALVVSEKHGVWGQASKNATRERGQQPRRRTGDGREREGRGLGPGKRDNATRERGQ